LIFSGEKEDEGENLSQSSRSKRKGRVSNLDNNSLDREKGKEDDIALDKFAEAEIKGRIPLNRRASCSRKPQLDTTGKGSWFFLK